MFDQWKNVMKLAFNPPPPFTYTPLPPNSIRLLTPCSPIGSDGYSWKLEVVNLDQPDLVFDALSYTWGSSVDTYPITCNGKLLRVHHNLYTALPYLARREADEPALPLWIDAVCINQIDQKEKMTQIPLMNEIYRRAEIVWAWLGIAEHQNQIPNAIQLLPLLELATREAKQFEMDFGESRYTGLDGVDGSIWSAMLHLVHNDWFHRVWVVQEAALARNLIFMCGRHQITGQQIRDAIRDLTALVSTITSDYAQILFIDNVPSGDVIFHTRDMVQSYMQMGNPLMARRILFDISTLTASSHQCSQAQDRVLGLLGIMDEAGLESAGIRDPPNGNVTLETLYTWFSSCLLTDTHTHSTGWYAFFDMAVYPNPQRNEALPSWVPDLHHINMTGLTEAYALSSRVPSYRGEDFPAMFQASSRTGELVRRGARQEELVVEGKLVDEITAVFEEIPKYPEDPGYSTPAFVAAVMQWLEEMLDWEETLSNALLGGGKQYSEANHKDGPDQSLVSVASYWHMLHWFVKDAGPAEDAHERHRDFRIYARRFLDTPDAPAE